MIIKAISALGNLQRDKYLKDEELPKRRARKGKGFDEILQKEQKRIERR